MSCTSGACSFAGRELFRRQWLAALEALGYNCAQGDPDQVLVNFDEVGFGFMVVANGEWITPLGFHAYAVTNVAVGAAFNTQYANLAPAAFFKSDSHCLARTMAHEALHVALQSVTYDDLARGSASSGLFAGVPYDESFVEVGREVGIDDESLAHETSKCITCGN